MLEGQQDHLYSVGCKYAQNERGIGSEVETIGRTTAFIQRQKKSSSYIAEYIISREVSLMSQPHIVDQLWEEYEGPQQDHPFLIGKEVGEREVDEQAQVKLYVEWSQFLADELWVLQIVDILAAPDEEEHFHVEDDEEHDVGEWRQDEEEVTARRTHYALNIGHRRGEVLDVAQRHS